MNYRNAIRESFVIKLALFLAYNTRAMNTPIIVTSGVIQFDVVDSITGNPIQYNIKPLERNSQFIYPGVNIEFLDEVDQSPDRLRNKRYLLPVDITICREIEGDVNPSAIGNEVRGIMTRILDALSDGHVEIWDFSGDIPINSNRSGLWINTGGYSLNDDSAALASGDIRHVLNVNIAYNDFSF